MKRLILITIAIVATIGSHAQYMGYDALILQTDSIAIDTTDNHIAKDNWKEFINRWAIVPVESDPIYSAWDKDYNDLTNKPTIPTAVSALTNDAGYISSESDPIFGAWDKDYYDLINRPTILTTTDVENEIAETVGFIVSDRTNSDWFANGRELILLDGDGMLVDLSSYNGAASYTFAVDPAIRYDDWGLAVNGSLVNDVVNGEQINLAEGTGIDLSYSGGTLTIASTASGTSPWTANSYGIYNSGKVGIGSAPTSTSATLSVSGNFEATQTITTSSSIIAGDNVIGFGTGYFHDIRVRISDVLGHDVIQYGGTVHPINGATGTFTSADGKTITVTQGIITGIN